MQICSCNRATVAVVCGITSGDGSNAHVRVQLPVSALLATENDEFICTV